MDDLIEKNDTKINKLFNLSMCLFQKIKTKKCKLKEILLLNKRGISPLERNKDIIVINQKCIRNGFIDYVEKGFHDLSKNVSSDLFLSFGDVLVNSMGTGTLGRISTFVDNEKAIPHSCVTLLRANVNKIGKFTFYCLMKNYEPAITLMGQGSTGQTTLNNKLLEEMTIDCPVYDIEAENKLCSIYYYIAYLREKNKRLKSAKELLLKKYFG